MKIKNLLLLTAAASLSMSAFAQVNGEYVDYTSGTPTQDHFFVRGNYDDMGDAAQYNNTVSFKAGTPQQVWIHLDDDEIYLNEAIQALDHQAYNSSGSLYDEITYNGYQFDIYLPSNVRIITVDNVTLQEYNEDEAEGDPVDLVKGDRMPTTSTLSWAKKEGVIKVIDGKNYDVYTFTCFNDKAFGTHFSASTPAKYKQNGALKKDATLLGIYLQNDDQDQVVGPLEQDMILGNMMFTLNETSEMFFFGTGGQGENRYMQFNRVKLFGSSSVVENLATKTISSVKYYNIAGMESNNPFDGVNIQVTTYNDGTTTTCKVIK